MPEIQKSLLILTSIIKLFEMEKFGQNTSIRGFWGHSFECRHQNLILFTGKLNMAFIT